MADKKPFVGGATPGDIEQLQAGDYLTSTTPTAGDSSTRVATTAFVANATSGGGTPDFVLQAFGVF
jgi:hypothetical protein